MQKKTFTKWVNAHLQRSSLHVDDLFVDLRDGIMLIRLLENISGEKLVSRLLVCDLLISPVVTIGCILFLNTPSH